MDEEPKIISTRNLVLCVIFLCVLFGGIAFLIDIIKDDSSTFDVSHRGAIPVVVNDEQRVAEATLAMMPLMPTDSGAQVLYVEAKEGCNSTYSGSCINVRSGPGTEYPAVLKLRDGVVLRVERKVRIQNRDWYKITFDEWVRYPDRVGTELYVAGDAVHAFFRQGPEDWKRGMKVHANKRIVVDLSDQLLYAYDGDELFMGAQVSTGLDSTPTPVGSFSIFRKMPSRYMQGPIPGVSEDVYDLPGVPWTMYFTSSGAAIHGAYWHADFGNQHSHGCINLFPYQARLLYDWADVGTSVTVQE